MRCFTTTPSRPGPSTATGGSAMSWRKMLLSTVAIGLLSPALAFDFSQVPFGRSPTPDEIKLWDIDVRPDGKGLPDGSGTAEAGKAIFADNCAGCHGEGGVGGIKDRLA